MRGLLIINPRATTTSTRVTDVLVHAFADEIDLQVTMTTHRGHAKTLGAQARADNLDVVITLGGDGVIHEVVNGMLADGPGPDVPILATIPGGSGNVFARALGLPLDPVEAAGEILDGLRDRRTRRIGLGCVRLDGADTVWFVANAGLGIDAEIIEAMEQQRSKGHVATPLRYLQTAVRHVLVGTDRRHPRLTLSRTGQRPVTGVHVAIVQNTAPWTFLGPRPIDPCPLARFETGLDLFALRSMAIPNVLRAARRMIMNAPAGSAGKHVLVWHDQAEFTVQAEPATPMQIDGESMGRVRIAEFQSVPDALVAIV
jgi:diacylglycerol kinase family enzyme